METKARRRLANRLRTAAVNAPGMIALLFTDAARHVYANELDDAKQLLEVNAAWVVDWPHYESVRQYALKQLES